MSDEAPEPSEDLPEQMRIRREKRDRILAAGGEAYPVGFPRTASLREVRAAHSGLPPDTVTGHMVGVTGRVIFTRNTGKLCFATLREGDGTELQVMLSLDRVGPASLADWKSLVDIGDHVGVEGEVVTSKRGELSVLADRWAVTSKALAPLPVAHKPMGEETRVRQRYLDLISRPEARRMAEARSTTARSLRESMHLRGFVEVETPMLQTVHGGAAARPFRTHINAYDMDLYLRIAPELFLKRAVIGGIEKVFEINRNFRNEGADATHSPEFAMLEAYEAYGDYNSMARLTRELIQEAVIATFGSTTARHFNGSEHDLAGTWATVSLYGAVSAAVGAEVTPDTPIETLRSYAERHEIAAPPGCGPGKFVEELFETLCVDMVQAPTFVYDFPVDTSPLVRAHRSIPGVVEKWDLYIFGTELATGYSELVDPVVQRSRLVEQAAAAQRGDPEAMALDEDFLRALEHGMPPTGGIGMGIDRLLQVLTGSHGVRETILFPFVRPG